MSKSITPIIFGTTDGLEVRHLPFLGDQILRLEDSWIDLKESDINLLDDNPLYYFQRREHLGSVINFLGAYWAVKEIGYSRQGSFVGAGFWFEGVVVNSHEIVKEIDKLHKSLAVQAIVNGQFRKKISETNLQLEINVANTIIGSVSRLPKSSNSAKKVFLQVGNDSVETILNWIQKSEASLLFSEIFMGTKEHYTSFKNLSNDKLPFQNLSSLLDECYLILQSQTLKNTEIIKKKIEDDFIKKENEIKINFQKEISKLKGDAQDKDVIVKNLLGSLNVEQAKIWRQKLFPSLEAATSASLMPKSMKRPVDSYEKNTSAKTTNENTYRNTSVVEEENNSFEISNFTFYTSLVLIFLLFLCTFYSEEILLKIRNEPQKPLAAQVQMPTNKPNNNGQEEVFPNSTTFPENSTPKEMSIDSKDKNKKNDSDITCFQKEQWVSVLYPVDIGAQEGEGLFKEFTNKIKPFCKPLLSESSCSQKLKIINLVLTKQNSNYIIELPKSCMDAANNSNVFLPKFIIKDNINQKQDVKVLGNVPPAKRQ